jgi:hypothetical protein
MHVNDREIYEICIIRMLHNPAMQKCNYLKLHRENVMFS